MRKSLFTGVGIIAFSACMRQKSLNQNYKSPYFEYTKDDVPKGHVHIRNKGKRTTVADKEIMSRELIFDIVVPDRIQDVSTRWGAPFFHIFSFPDKVKICVVDNISGSPESKNGLDKKQFLDYIKQYPVFEKNIGESNIPLKENRWYGIYAKDSFMVCFVNAKASDTSRYFRAIKSFL